VARYGLQQQTLWYRAPEVLLGDNTFGAPADIWSLAVTKRTMKVLKLCRWLAEAVAKKHGVYRMPDVTSQNEQVVPVLTRSV
jgi:serine/threonine protein kinase